MYLFNIKWVSFYYYKINFTSDSTSIEPILKLKQHRVVILLVDSVGLVNELNNDDKEKKKSNMTLMFEPE